MSLVRKITGAIFAAACLLGCAGQLSAGVLGTTSTLANPIVLASGVREVADNLKPSFTMPDTWIGQYDPSYATQLPTAPVYAAGPHGPHQFIKLLNIPLSASGAAYFRVSGIGDNSFAGSHTENGRYSYQFEVFSSQGLPLAPPALQLEDVRPSMIDNVWVNPAASQANGKVNLIVENLQDPGPGETDFFVFTGLPVGQAYTAMLVDLSPNFQAQLGRYNALKQLQAKNSNAIPVLTGTTTSSELLFGITGKGDNSFKGNHSEVGDYRLVLMVVPEPSALLLFGSGLGGLLALANVRRRAKLRRGVAADE